MLYGLQSEKALYEAERKKWRQKKSNHSEMQRCFLEVHTENTEVKGEGMDGYREMTERDWW